MVMEGPGLLDSQLLEEEDRNEEQDPDCPSDIRDQVGRGRKVDIWCKCAYECGPPRKEKWFRQTNARGLFICIECFAAVRCIKGQCKTAEAKKAVKDLPLADPEQWRARVRAC